MPQGNQSFNRNRNRRRRSQPQRPNIPNMPVGVPPRPDFLPNTPGFESDQRGNNDQLMSILAQINSQRGLLPGQLNMFKARQGTDVDYQTQLLRSNMADRGILGSSDEDYLRQRDITLPATRNSQDFALRQQELLNQLAQAESQAYLGFNQAQAEALLQRAADAASSMPLGLPNWGNNFGTPSKNRPKRKSRKKK